MPRHRTLKGSNAPAKYISRGMALRKLQVSLADFRRLCILKGVYPQDPRRKVKGTDKVYYFSKDILFLAHEPLLQKFREFKTFLRKHKRAVARHEYAAARSLESHKPVYKLDHIIRERYPTFADALRDLDDALSMVHLFMALPQESRVPGEVTADCAQLAREFQYIVARQRALRRVFVSVKGIYLQAEVQGETVTWITPHEFVQQIPADVDFRVMLTFVEFYRVLLGFVNFRLFQATGVAYPPTADEDKLAAGAWLASFAGVPDLSVEPEEAVAAADAEAAVGHLADATAEAKAQHEERTRIARLKRLFAGLTVALSREVPRRTLELVIYAAGGKLVEAGSGADISHLITDRPAEDGAAADASAEVVQPQWVFDSVNARALLPVAPYARGAALPPHLSPFVAPEDEDEHTLAAAGPSAVAPPTVATDDETEEHKLRRAMMGKKAARLYGRMQHGIGKRRAEAEARKTKRRRNVK